MRIAPIIPDAAQPNTNKLMTPRHVDGLGDLLDRLGYVVASLVGEGKCVDDVVDHPRAQAVVLEHHSDDCDQDDGERREREQHAVGDACRVLVASIGEVTVDGLGTARTVVRAMSSGRKSSGRFASACSERRS